MKRELTTFNEYFCYLKKKTKKQKKESKYLSENFYRAITVETENIKAFFMVIKTCSIFWIEYNS